MDTSLPLIFSGVIAVATIIYVVFSGQIVAESVKLREIQTAPNIIVYLQPSDQSNFYVDIIVKNIGGGTAYNLAWTFDENTPFMMEDRSVFRRIKFFDGVTYLAPGQEFRSLIGTWPDILREPITPAFSLIVKYESIDKKPYSQEFIIDPGNFYGRMALHGQPLREMADSLKQIERRLDYIFTGFHRPKIDIYTREDREEESTSREAYKAEQEAKEQPPNQPE